MRRFASNVPLSSCIRVRSDLDTALLACAAGDEDGLKTIYDQEATRLLGMAYRIVGERDLAEDVLQDAFLQIWQYASSFDANRGSARGWIYCVVRNCAITVRLARLHEVAIEDRILLAMFDGNAVQVSRLPENCALRRGLEQLDPRRRDSLILAYVHGCTHDEIAERLRVPVGTAKVWIRRSLITLRAL